MNKFRQAILDRVHKTFETKLAGRKMINFNVFTDPCVIKQRKVGFFCWGEIRVDGQWKDIVHSDTWMKVDADLHQVYPEGLLEDICEAVREFWDMDLQNRYNRCEIIP